MPNSFKLLLILFLANLNWQNSIGLPAKAQTITFTSLSEFEYSFFYSAYTALFDEMGRPYLYVASNELGVVVFDISDIHNPVPVDTITKMELKDLNATNIFLDGNYLYVSLGGFQSSGNNAGIAIIDVTNPDDLALVDTWDTNAFTEGSAIVIVEGNYAYLGAMDAGVLIFDVSDKSDIQYVSFILPDPNFPQVPGLTSIPNARGMAIKNDKLFLCYDAGGLRVIDVSDKANPVEIEKYVNTSLDSVARPAYNNILIDGNYGYIPVDYCGLEVVDLSDPSDIKNVDWINPWGCNNFNWQGRPGHTNQVVKAKGQDIIFVSGADSEVLAYDISDPENPELIGEYGTVGDTVAAWGVGIRGNLLALALVDNPFGLGYAANYGGIRILEWSDATGIKTTQQDKSSQPILFPNPVNEATRLKFKALASEKVSIEVYNSLGTLTTRLKNNGQSNIELGNIIDQLPEGLFFFKILIGDRQYGINAVKL